MLVLKSVLVACVFFLIFLSICDGANILCLFLSPIPSHNEILRTITQELHKRGHAVFVITPNPIFSKGQTLDNITEILFDEESIEYQANLKNTLKEYSKNKIDSSIPSQINKRLEFTFRYFCSQLKSKKTKQFINNKANKFDLGIINVTFFPAWIYSYVYKIPIVGVATASVLPIYYKPLGHLEHLKYYPNFIQKHKVVSYWQMVKNIYEHSLIQNEFNRCEEKIDDMVREEFQTTLPSLSASYSNIHVMLVNIHPIWEGIRPTSQNVFHSGSLQCRAEDILTKKLQEYLDSSKNGVIYMSFGTGVVPSTLPNKTITEFMEAFAQLPYDVLWRWDKEEMPGKPDNVRLFKWLPQADVLRHPKIKLFITQGGQHSTDEAIDAGVPLIGIPMMFDQFANAEKYVRFGIGKRLDFNTVTLEEFKKAIETVVGDKSYHQNIIKLRTLLRDKPMTSMDKTMWAIDYVLRHGGAKHLQSPSANLSWKEYFEFELLFTFLAICVIVLCSFVKIVLIIKVFVFRLIDRTSRRDVKVDGKIL